MDTRFHINNIPQLKSRRKELRQNLTPPEKRLWLYLQGSQLGAKFRRQPSVGSYILDFYCPQYRLAIEIDGAFHDSEQSHIYDNERTNFLAKSGITVLRFTNKDVMNNLDGVLSEIKKYLK